jgi:integrase
MEGKPPLPGQWIDDLPEPLETVEDVEDLMRRVEVAKAKVQAEAIRKAALLNATNPAPASAFFVSVELAGLHVEDIVDNIIYVGRSVWRGIEVSRKTRKGYRAVPVDSNVVAVLNTFLGGRTTGRVFQGKRGGFLDNHTITGKVLKPVCKRLGIPGAGCHAFRHGRVSMSRQNQVPVPLIKSMIGHSSLNTTDGYTHFPPSYVGDTIERNGLSCTQVHIS